MPASAHRKERAEARARREDMEDMRKEEERPREPVRRDRGTKAKAPPKEAGRKAQHTDHAGGAEETISCEIARPRARAKEKVCT